MGGIAGAFFTTIGTSFDDGFNTGQQKSITLTDANGVMYDLGRVTRFSSEAIVTELDSKTIVKRGYVDYKDARQGWTGEIAADRTNGAQDRLEALQERLWHAKGRQLYMTIEERVENDNGSVDTFTYERAAVRLTSAGSWTLDEKVEVVMKFRATERVEQAA